MYTVIIVDDEKWIIEGLKAGVDWAALGYEVIGDAENGQKAIELIEEYRPNVVFTDIRMPGMNGLELIKKVKEKLPDTTFIVLSGYAEFAYAQKAINYGTFGYCLKPFELEEIEGLLARLAKSLSTKSNISCDELQNFYDSLCSGDNTSIKQILSHYEMIPDNKNKITPVVVIGNDRVDLKSEDIKYLSFKMNTNKYCYLIYNELSDAIYKCIKDNSELLGLSIGIGFPVATVSELESSINAASIASYGIFTTGKSGVYNHISSEIGIDKLLKDISDAIKRKDRIQFLHGLEEARAGLHTGKFNIKTAYLLFNIFVCLYFNDSDNTCGKLFEDYEHLYLHFRNVDAMIDYLKDNTLIFFKEDTGDLDVSVEHATIKKVLKYINDNLSENISINDLSSKFFINPNYMCQLFKKEVGENFIEYTSRRRIEYACRLLSETSLGINQISEKCGFNDYFYFTRIFKKLTNVTPTQFRKELQTTNQ